MREFDICIVGSGAGCSTIAYELSRAGFDVVMLEKGEFYKNSDFFKDELAVSRRNIYIPNHNDQFHMVGVKNDEGVFEYVKTSSNGWNFHNGSMVGGSSNLMSGFFHRMKPNDFRLKSHYGEIDGANIVDWPISYEDLEPYYEKVERVVGVSGVVSKHSFLEPRSTKEFPYKATQEHPTSKWFDSVCEKLGFDSIVTPRAILSEPAMNRDSCSYSNYCGSYGCATGAKSHARSALLDSALKSKNLTLLTNSFVYKLDQDSTGKITQLHYYDHSKKSHAIKAKIFVLSAQAHESVRLLLNSKNRYSPKGIANEHDQVGKNLIFSAGGVGEGRFEFDDLTMIKQKELMVKGLFFNRSLQNWHEYREGERLLKGGTIDFLFEHANPVPRAMREIYDKDRNLNWGEDLKKKLLHSFTKSRVLTFEVFNDWLPTDECFLDVDENQKDIFGVNVGRFHLHGHEHDLKVANFLAKKAESVLQQMGAKEISNSISNSPPPNLMAGGCRFGDGKKSSVLDKNCKTHGVNNLYVCDASFMPTGGSVPYTWTIYANSFRVADIIKKRMKEISS